MVWKHYSQGKQIKNISSSTLAIIGVEWLILEFLSYFIPDIQTQFIVPLGLRYLFGLIIIAVVISLIRYRPINQISEKINDRDITISIVIGDFFSQKGDLIIGTNTTFDTNLINIISEKSIQGQFTIKYFNDNVSQLDEIIDNKLISSDDYEEVENPIGKKRKYPIGKTSIVKNDSVTAYFLAIADLNQNGAASSSFDNIISSLSNLWNYISVNGGIEPLVIPVLGTGFSRLEIKKELIIQEIVKSFIAACSEKRFTEKLTIVIYKSDYEKTDLELNRLHEFLKCQCKYAEFKQNSNPKIGTGIDK